MPPSLLGGNSLEPTHGSAPKCAGQYKANPIAVPLSVKLMLDYLGEGKAPLNLEESITSVIREGKISTYDLGGDTSTLDVAREAARNLGN